MFCLFVAVVYFLSVFLKLVKRQEKSRNRFSPKLNSFLKSQILSWLPVSENKNTICFALDLKAGEMDGDGHI